MQKTSKLTGKNVFVVEREPLIAHDVEQMLMDAGAASCTLAAPHMNDRDPDEEFGRFDLLMLDFRSTRGHFRPLVQRLSVSVTPTLILTTNGEAVIKPWLAAGFTILEKPFGFDDMLAALERLGFDVCDEKSRRA